MSDEPRDTAPDGKPDADPTIQSNSFASAGDSVGPYRLRESIGVGGMGEVWKAEQEKPVRRTVALKLIKAGMDSKQVLARFEAERQALALMDHPCIAKIFDAGSTEQGRPYFAMEYVEGIPIHEYCDRRKLSTKERLRLFRRVCEGVQHAHQKAILHRDLKPSNILVSDVDGTPSPKIIDFGVAKATTQRLTDKTMYTAMGAIIGTPEYMSPEQSELTGENVDTRTDVYSLGVVLYELLAGALPFDSKELRKAGFEGLQKLIREQDPPKPSARLSTLGEQTTQIAQSRGTNPRNLSSQLRGELDWITMKALEKDRNRRYESASAFAEDIQRHLKNEPVLAGPPSASYRLSKFVARNRLGVIAASIVIVVVLLGIAGTTIGMLRALRAERLASEEATAANEVAGFLVSLFQSANPWESLGEDVRVKEILDKGAGRIESELEDQPLIRARLELAIAKAYHELGLFDAAIAHREKALELREANLGATNLQVAEALSALAESIRFKHPWGGPKKEEGMRHLERAVEIWRSAPAEYAPMLARDLRDLLSFYGTEKSGQQDHEAVLSEALELYESSDLLDESSSDADELRLELRLLRGDLDESEVLKLKEQQIEADLSSGLSGLELLRRRANLAVVYRAQHRYEEALQIWDAVMRAGKPILSPDREDGHPLYVIPLLSSAIAYERMGDIENALRRYERAVRVDNEFRSAPLLRGAKLRRAILHARLGDFDQALPLFEECCASLPVEAEEIEETIAAIRGDCPVALPASLEALAQILRRLGREDDALEVEARVEPARQEVAEHMAGFD